MSRPDLVPYLSPFGAQSVCVLVLSFSQAGHFQSVTPLFSPRCDPLRPFTPSPFPQALSKSHPSNDSSTTHTSLCKYESIPEVKILTANCLRGMINGGVGILCRSKSGGRLPPAGGGRSRGRGGSVWCGLKLLMVVSDAVHRSPPPPPLP
ncbi:hypothetical protein E2C01_017215 [Portunus trituberculatus]|uniref:Uncharacterized protein n=1 Tax=Portunus trituberculatus TaxID=210409 RepID=A0A5B7DR06_PORTR|nr:hypothetical protein [Portunus trituberculatus]